jgi:hypothetical protein
MMIRIGKPTVSMVVLSIYVERWVLSQMSRHALSGNAAHLP